VPLAHPSSGCQYYMRRWLCEQRLGRMECRLLIRAAVVSVICVAGSMSSDWSVWGAACSSEQRLFSVVCVAGSVSSDWIIWSAACSSEQRLSLLYVSLAL
jgi:hypothetical protein